MVEELALLGRLAECEEIGNVIAFLASDAASYIHGTSMGANIAQQFAAKYSDRVDRLILNCGAAKLDAAGILVRKNLEAKLTRSVYYQLVDLGVEERLSGDKIFGVWSNKEFFKIGRL